MSKNEILFMFMEIEGEKKKNQKQLAGKNLFSNYGKWAIGANYDKVKVIFSI